MLVVDYWRVSSWNGPLPFYFVAFISSWNWPVFSVSGHCMKSMMGMMYRANLSLLLFVVIVLDDSEKSDAKQSESAQP